MLVDGRWTPTFPNARYVVSDADFEYWRSELDASQGNVMSSLLRESFNDSIQPILDAGLLDLISLNGRLCDEVRLMPTPGHTPGHVSVVVTSEGQSAVITGDTTHHPCQLLHMHWSSDADHNAAQAEETRKQMFADLAGTPTLVIGTHWAGATAGHVIREGEHYKLVA
jgi:glyoxylase-like metal-dependent hydrolase (beta-lactamase superfamily II)